MTDTWAKPLVDWPKQLRAHADHYEHLAPGWGFPTLAADLRDAADEFESMDYMLRDVVQPKKDKPR